LHGVHDKLAETYDETNARREFSNKYQRYRKILLSYAEGRVLEMGVGTGTNLSFYPRRVSEFVGVDWSDAMLMKAFGKLDDLKTIETPSAKPTQYKLIRGDCLHLNQFEDNSFDCVVDILTLNSVYSRE